MPAEPSPNEKRTKQSTADRLLSGMFLVSVAGFSMLFGFGRAFTKAKKSEKIVNQSVMINMEANSLALRALGWGSVIAVTGVGVISYGIWKAIGGSNMEEFRQAAGNLLPKISKNQGGRTEFKNLTELFQYIIDEDNRRKVQTESRNQSLDYPDSSIAAHHKGDSTLHTNSSP